MRARFAPKRTLMAAMVCLGVVVSVSRSNEVHVVQPLIISGVFKGRTVMVTATGRSAGAIESLQWGGVEFLDANDHGRDLQSAISFDGLGECDNPTEAGASRDGNRPQSSSSWLHKGFVANNVLRTSSHMAYWLRQGQRSAECKHALNEGDPSPVSSTRLAKTVRFLPGFGNVLEHRISFDLARPRSLAVIEVLTAYMPDRFDTFYRYNPASDRMEALSDGPGEQDLPVVLATRDGTHALGLYTPQTGDIGLKGPGLWQVPPVLCTRHQVECGVPPGERCRRSAPFSRLLGIRDPRRCEGGPEQAAEDRASGCGRWRSGAARRRGGSGHAGRELIGRRRG